MSTLTDQHIAQAMQAYVDHITAGDPDTVVALFAEDPVVEDPIGSEPARGHAAPREFLQTFLVPSVVMDSRSRLT